MADAVKKSGAGSAQPQFVSNLDAVKAKEARISGMPPPGQSRSKRLMTVETERPHLPQYKLGLITDEKQAKKDQRTQEPDLHAESATLNTLRIGSATPGPSGIDLHFGQDASGRFKEITGTRWKTTTSLQELFADKPEILEQFTKPQAEGGGSARPEYSLVKLRDFLFVNTKGDQEPTIVMLADTEDHNTLGAVSITPNGQIGRHEFGQGAGPFTGATFGGGS